MTIETKSFGTLHLRPRHLRPLHLRPIHSRQLHLRPQSFATCSFETTFTWDLRPHSFETTSSETTFIWDHIHLSPLHLRPHSFETKFIWDYTHLRSHSFYAMLKWSCFDLLYITFKIYFPLLCGRPEVLQGDYSFEILQGCALPCAGVTHAGFLKHPHSGLDQGGQRG